MGHSTGQWSQAQQINIKLKNKRTKVMHSPSQSSDLNLTEMLW